MSISSAVVVRVLVVWLYAAWALMVLLGVLHGRVHAVPAFGYLDCVVGQCLLDIVLGSAYSGTARRVEWLVKQSTPVSLDERIAAVKAKARRG